MSTYFCHACGALTDEMDMGSTPERRDEPSWMVCLCGSDDYEETRPCDGCEELTAESDFEDGTDLCGSCWEIENPDTAVIEAQHKERLRGIA